MQKVKIGLGALVVGILAVSMTTVAVGSIIPAAQQAKDNAAVPDNSPVITVINEDWVLTPLQNAAESIIPTADGKIIPVAERAREHVYENAAAWEHSPVININEDGDWVLTLLPNAAESTIPTADGKIIPVADAAKLHAAAPDSSPVISTNEDGDWILTLLPNAVESGAAALDVLLGADCEFPGVFSTELTQEQIGLDVATVPDSSSFVATPEPATMALLTLGTLVLVRRRR